LCTIHFLNLDTSSVTDLRILFKWNDTLQYYETYYVCYYKLHMNKIKLKVGKTKQSGKHILSRRLKINDYQTFTNTLK